jgi:dTDP-glucose pyrophosphorylase
MMKNLSRYTIKNSASVVDALEKLNKLPELLTLFVLDDNKKVIGTLTDGDIRRGLINGLRLEDSLDKFVFKYFSFLTDGKDNFGKLKEFRKRQLKAVPLLDKEGHLLKIYNFSEIKSILPIDAVIMAGGRGERLRPLTEKTPKPLLKIGNKEIISYNLDRLYQYGITNQYITVNYLAEQIKTYCKNYNKEINFNIVNEPKMLGTAGALSLIEDFKNDTILLMNSDLLTNIDYEDFYKSFIDNNADMLVASIPYEVNLPYAVFEVDDRNVKSLKEKPGYTYYANAGIYLFKKELINLVPKNKTYNATDFMEDVISLGNKLVHYPIRGYWLDVGKHKDFEKAQMDIAHINWE